MRAKEKQEHLEKLAIKRAKKLAEIEQAHRH